MKVIRNFDFLSTLESIAEKTGPGVWMEVSYTPKKPNIRAEVSVGFNDTEYLNFTYYNDGHSQNTDDPREICNDKQLKDRLCETLGDIMKEERLNPAQKDKLLWIKGEIEKA